MEFKAFCTCNFKLYVWVFCLPAYYVNVKQKLGFDTLLLFIKSYISYHLYLMGS